MKRREEILRAVSAAAEMKEQFTVGNRTGFDVVRAVTELGIPLMFQPLDKLWGALIAVDQDRRGILVTSKLDLAVQRFTLAHELGHALLGHRLSLDETVGYLGRLGPASRPDEEIAADTFASELLAPKSLILASAQRHGWTRTALSRGENAYQLALRLGLSYQATCWALAAHKIIPRTIAESLQAKPLKSLKRQAAPENLITNSWAAVWQLTVGDSGTDLEAGPDDLFAVQLHDKASAGYLWELVDSSPAQIVNEVQGGDFLLTEPSSRTVFLRFGSSGSHRLVFEHRRRWNKSRIEHIDITVRNYGKELKGLPRRERLATLAESA